jgi:hypothetical protein
MYEDYTSEATYLNKIKLIYMLVTQYNLLTFRYNKQRDGECEKVLQHVSAS